MILSRIKKTLISTIKFWLTGHLCIWFRLYMKTGNIDQTNVMLGEWYIITSIKLFFLLWFFIFCLSYVDISNLKK